MGKKQMKIKKNTKGITLIALVVTIIVLLILAGVSIAMLTGENGILTQAQKAKNQTGKAQVNEANILTNYEQIINSNTGITLETITGYETTNTVTQDNLGNRVVVPAGFKVVNPTDSVEDGIIIKDMTYENTKGSEFVWIPLGTIHRKSKEDITINLDRYIFESDGNEIPQGTAEITDGSILSPSQDKDQELETSTNGNITAKDLESFLLKAKTSGGFYIGRYEARDGTTQQERNASTNDKNQLTCSANNYIYNYVTQPQAAILSQNMYINNNFTSDLVNSYAWDTALVFIQKCSSNNTYSQQTSLNTVLENKGTNKDVLCNIYDMASNSLEWSTESSNKNTAPCVQRGGRYGNNQATTSGRYNDNTTNSYNAVSFRPILYLN